MTIVAFTGPTHLSTDQRHFAIERMLDWSVFDTFRSGCAYGLDTTAAWMAMTLDIPLELYVPGADHNATMVNRLAPSATHVIRCHMPGDRDPYRTRNRAMVLEGYDLSEPCDCLHAFVTSPKFYRSGEWMTINIAKRAKIKVVLEVLP